MESGKAFVAIQTGANLEECTILSGISHSCAHGSGSPANQGEPGEPG